MYDTNDQKLAAVVDYKTGEVTDYLYTGDAIIHKPQEQREYDEKYVKSFNRKEAFVKVYTDTLYDLYQELTRSEKVVVLGIIPFISYSDGILRCDQKILDLKGLSELLDENYDSLRKSMSSLIKKGAIAKTAITSDKSDYVTKNCYVVNPYIFFKGTDLEKRFGQLFKDTKWSGDADTFTKIKSMPLT